MIVNLKGRKFSGRLAEVFAYLHIGTCKVENENEDGEIKPPVKKGRPVVKK